MQAPEIQSTHIGTIPLGIDGSDEYILLTRSDDDLDHDTAREWLLPLVYRESMRPGGYFCTSVSIVPYHLAANKCLAIIHHRFDV